MLSRLLQPEIKSLIENKQFGILKDILQEWTPTDIADLITNLEEKERVILFRLLHTEIAADTFEYLDFDTQIELLKSMGNEEVAKILNEMDPDDRTALFEELPASAAKQLIQLLSPEERKIALHLLGYPENSIGRLMTPDYVAVNSSWTIKEALDYIRENGKNKETLNVVYVVDGKGRLIDDIKIREFLLAPLDKKVYELMDENFVALNVYDDQEKAVSVLKKYDRVALPVVDNSGVLLGIVTVDDVMDVAEEETTEDIQKQAAVGVLEEPYSDIPILKMIKKRVGWLSVLFVGQMFTATAMAYFEDAIEKAVVLALFVPLIISSGGNSGSQAASLVVRAMALGEITLNDWLKVFKRELLTGLSLGLILALIGFLRFNILPAPDDGFETYWIIITLVVSFSLIGVVMWGTLIGSMLPFLMKRLDFDPAASSTPFVATLVDVTGILIYFSIAMSLLKGKVL
ncbi:MAG: magnesium transporter [Ignavibacterium sp.]|nr:magnesium transporter [Ignavibacterium sp.]MDW8374235.1 magnesium transporter [Ignavibacteriales bacterium]